MSDLEQRMQELDHLQPPDLWLSIEVRANRPQTFIQRILQWLRLVSAAQVAMAVAVAVAVAAIIAVGFVAANVAIQEIETADRPEERGSEKGGSGETGGGGQATESDSSGSRAPRSSSGAGTRQPGGKASGGGSEALNLAGDRIAFVVGGPSPMGQVEIYAMDLDGTDRLLLGPGGQPDWSPDGKKILFARGESAEQVCFGARGAGAQTSPPCEVWVMNADGSAKRRLTSGHSPDWSPDGRRIAFLRGQDDWEIHVMNADGSGITQLTRSAGSAEGPDWSPDGARIAFNEARCDQTTCRSNIHVMRSDGSGISQLTFDEVWSGAPTWSPDGSRIAFQSFVGGSDANFEIHTMASDGSDTRRVTHDAGTSSPNDNRDADPAWSPDGRIIFSKDPDGPPGNYFCYFYNAQPKCGSGGPTPPEIFLMNADGSGLRHIVQGRVPAFAPRPR